MDKIEAYTLIQNELTDYQNKRYFDLVEIIGNSQMKEVRGKTSTLYQIEIKVLWEDKKEGNVKVIALIDSLAWYKFSPLSEEFVMKSNGNLVIK